MSRAALKKRGDYLWWYHVTTRWADNDAYGHVNNTVHYQWFDSAVNAWLIERGLLDVAAGDPIGLVVETGCRYARSLAYPQSIDVGVRVEAIGTSSVRYACGIFASDELEAAAEGFFIHVYVGRDSRRPTRLSDAWRAAFSELCA